MSDAQSTGTAAIAERITRFIADGYAAHMDFDAIPRDQSLLELGILDSYGVIELVEFLEAEWSISIADEEITKEKMGSINKMATLIAEKTA